MSGIKGIFIFIVVHSLAGNIHAQDTAALFQNEQPLEIRFDISLQDIRKNTSDSIYFPTLLYYKSQEGRWDSIPVSIRARGNFRRKHCFFPPVRIKIKKGDSNQTVFQGIKSLKLVLPCQVAKDNNYDLIVKEYICYKLYEPVTQYRFGTRMVNVTLTDVAAKHEKTYQLSGIFIEDDDAVARRHQAKVIEQDNFNPLLFADTSVLRLDLFQYMIANTDFSTTFSHNIKILQTKTAQYIPIPYDFDMSGFVDAPYATFDASLGIKSVRDRLYKGYCRNEKVAEFVRSEYIALEPKINAVINGYENSFDPKEFAGMKKYISEFFKIIKNDAYYRENITRKCRTK